MNPSRHRRWRHKRENEEPMPDALAFFLTWTTYGTWLPGDARGWVRRGKGFQLPDPVRETRARELMTEPPCKLNWTQRMLVERTVARHCQIRGWQLHAVQCRSNHVHVVVTATGDAEKVRDELKAWCTRKLKELERRLNKDSAPRQKWWSEKGSTRYIGDEESLVAVVEYVCIAQDRKDRDNA